MKAKHTYRGGVMRTDPAAIAHCCTSGDTCPGCCRKVRVGRETSGRSGKGVSVITGCRSWARNWKPLRPV